MINIAGPNLYQRIIESSPSAVVVLDVTHDILYVNPVSMHVLGIGRDYIGHNIDEIEHLRPIHAFLATLIDSNQDTIRHHRGGEVRLEMPDGTVNPCQCNAIVLRSPEGAIEAYTLVVRESSEFRSVMDSAETNYRGDLAPILNSIVENVRQPLNSLMALGHVLKQQAGLQEEDRTVQLFHDAAEKLNKTITSLLIYGRASGGRSFVSVNLNEILAAEEARIQRRLHEKQATFQWQKGSFPAVLANQDDLQTILSHLLDNALDAIYTHGKISIHCIDGAKPEQVVVQIEDDGIGIEPALITRIAEPCFSTKPGFAGMGFTIASRLIEECGGRITVDSEPEHGTVITLTLRRGENAENGKKGSPDQ